MGKCWSKSTNFQLEDESALGVWGVVWCDYVISSLVAQLVRNLPRIPRFGPWVRKIPYRREQQPTPVSLPGESHGQRSLVGYHPWGHELDMT